MNTTTLHRALSRAALGVATACLLVAPLAAEPAFEIATMNAGSTAIVWQPTFAVETMVLTVSGPSGTARYEFDGSTKPTLGLYDAAGYPLADGSYTWELRAIPALSNEIKADLAAARATGDMTQIEGLQHDGYLPSEPLVQSGYVRVEGGAFVTDAEEPAAPAARTEQVSSTSQGVRSTSDAVQVIGQDLVVQGSQCIGVDCTSTEDFGFDTLRLKENNLRIKFQDTSTGSFPSVDWQLTANDSNNGGANRFSIEDTTNSKTPFTVEANAPNHSLYVDDDGHVGVGTSAPVLNVHVVEGNTPAVRLEQDGSVGFSPQTWDVAGNEANFFIRDVTNGSALPIRIEPGTATNMLYLDSAERIGIGTNSPDAPLDLDTSVSGLLMQLQGTGDVFFRQTNKTTGQFVDFNLIGDEMRINFGSGNSGPELRLDNTGNLTVTGVVSGASSRTLKDNIVTVDAREMLNRVLALPVTEWTYIREMSEGVRHVGPIAEDFYQLFSLGKSDKRLAATDTAGVALAAIQGLNQVVEEKDAELEELKGENAQLAARLAALEALVSTIVSQ